MAFLECIADGRVILATLTLGEHGLLGAGAVAELAELVASVEADPAVGAVVLHSTHPERFVAHYDVEELCGLAAVMAEKNLVFEELLQLQQTLRAIERSGVAYVAAIAGSTLGGGCELALACDLRVMASGPAVIGLPEVLLGLVPGAGGTQRLPRLVGRGRALEIMLERCWISSEEALRIGMVHEVCLPDAVVDAALRRARRLARRPKHAVAAIKQASLAAYGTDDAAGFHLEQALILTHLRNAETVALLHRYVDDLNHTGELPFYDESRRRALVDEGLCETRWAAEAPEETNLATFGTCQHVRCSHGGRA